MVFFTGAGKISIDYLLLTRKEGQGKGETWRMLNWNEFAIWAGYAGTAIVVIAYTIVC